MRTPISRSDLLYRGSRIIASNISGKPTARAFLGTKCFSEVCGTDIKEAISEMKNVIDTRIQNRPDGIPTVEEYEYALSALRDELSRDHLAMLKAHCEARADHTSGEFEDRTMSAEQLAEAAHHDGYDAANLHYGLLGRRVAELLDYPPPLSEERGEPLWIDVLAIGKRSDQGRGGWNWTLRPEVALALERLGWIVW